MTNIILFLAILFLAYSNGANDNFKGVATLFGSHTTNYKVAIWWATLSTFLGSIGSIFLAGTLLKNFSGKGLVPDAIANTTEFHLAVVMGAGLTVILATLAGFPISTTHGLTGGLVGAGLVAIGTQVNWITLGNSFFLPLLFSPIVAIVLGTFIYRLFHSLRRSLGIDKAWCICIGKTQRLIPISQANSTQILSRSTTTEVALNTTENCQQIYQGNFLGIQSQQLVDFCHFLSAGIVSFARGLNDTPKIVALFPIVGGFSIQGGMLAVGLGMAIGGLLNARKVAETMSQKITRMNRSQGLSSNLVTGMLVIAASQFGLPVSTTHVSVGSIFGVGLVSQKANPNVFYQILLSWLLTLPFAALFSGFTYWISHR